MSENKPKVFDCPFCGAPQRVKDTTRMANHEIIHWHAASEKPDTDTTVLICSPNADEPIWTGYWDSERGCWCWSDAMTIHEGVTHWSHLPHGPK